VKTAKKTKARTWRQYLAQQDLKLLMPRVRSKRRRESP
jgi:hypothetical protein